MWFVFNLPFIMMIKRRASTVLGYIKNGFFPIKIFSHNKLVFIISKPIYCGLLLNKIMKWIITDVCMWNRPSKLKINLNYYNWILWFVFNLLFDNKKDSFDNVCKYSNRILFYKTLFIQKAGVFFMGKPIGFSMLLNQINYGF